MNEKKEEEISLFFLGVPSEFPPRAMLLLEYYKLHVRVVHNSELKNWLLFKFMN